MRVAVLLFCLGLPTSGMAQDRRIGVGCAAALCEPGVIYAVAIDSIQKRVSDSLPPRILQAMYLAPFKPVARPRPASVGDFDPGWALVVGRHLPGTTTVDSAEVVAPSGELLPGGSLLVVSPLDWLGEDLVRLEVARYFGSWHTGEQYFVICSRGRDGWHVKSLAVGWQN